MFLLVDCDNFFVSCERIFQPSLKNRPVVVLSNNDGCIIARSNEAKALGIPMGYPYFKVKHDFQAQKGISLSSHPALYADISRRVMSLLRSLYSSVEVYSIDEAFLTLSEEADPEQEALLMHRTILQQMGLSVSIGIAPTKTLCKAAVDIAKKMPTDKICLLTEEEKIKSALKEKDVGDLWGIGRRTAAKLRFMGYINALEFREAPSFLIRKKLGIAIEQVRAELNGLPCKEIMHEETQKSYICSRSFDNGIYGMENLKSIIAGFVDNVCRRMRRQKAVADALTVFIETNRFQRETYYQNARTEVLFESTDNTAKFMEALSEGLPKIYRPHLAYKRAGVMLSGVESLSSLQGNLFVPPSEDVREKNLMRTFDVLNKKMGASTVFFGTQFQSVKAFSEKKTTTYTTGWNTLAEVK